MKTPNLLFVFSDQHRACDLGCYGNNEVFSPNLDAFARVASRFTNCVSNSPLCVPVRGTMMTGLMPHRHRAITNDLPIDSTVKSIAHVMNENGYHTGYIGKWHLGGIPRDKAIEESDRLGFTEWKAYNCNHVYMNGYYYDEENNRHNIDGYEPIVQTDLAIDFIERQTENPWGLVLSYGPPHDPYFKVPDRYLDLYREKQITLRPNVPEQIKQRPGITIPKVNIEHTLKGYYAHITALDEQFGRLIDTLQKSGQLDNTIVVYTSDHGDMLGSQGLLNKQLPYEEASSVPLLVYYKGVTVPLTSNEIISHADLPISLLSLMGLRLNEERDGQDLHRLLLDPQAKGADFAYLCDLVPCHQAADRGDPEWRGIKTTRYTYARSFDHSFCVLYDNQNDPYQLHNLAKDKSLCIEPEALLQKAATTYDDFLPWDQLIRKHGYLTEWNESQAYFKRPLLILEESSDSKYPL